VELSIASPPPRALKVGSCDTEIEDERALRQQHGQCVSDTELTACWLCHGILTAFDLCYCAVQCGGFEALSSGALTLSTWMTLQTAEMSGDWLVAH